MSLYHIMQHQLTTHHPLLSPDGSLIEAGWATRLLLEYQRENVHAHKYRIKEWDYFEILNPDYGIVLLIYDVGYLANAIVKWMDFRTHQFEECVESVWGSGGSLHLPPTADQGDISFSRNDTIWVSQWDHPNHQRKFHFQFPKFRGGQGIHGDITLIQVPNLDTMVNVIPFRNKKQFVYVQKINCMIPDGKVNVAGETYSFSESNHSYGCLDWSRAVFPYHCEWRWCTASGKVGGIPFGFNIDYGFGIESSKNMVFHNSRGHHMDEVTYSWDLTDVTKDWVFSSNDNRVNLRLKVMHVERGGMNYILLKTKLLKVYGFFTGEVVLDNGTKVQICPEDRLFGSAEAVTNYW